MRYEIITDKLNYCQIIRHTGNPKFDVYELDISKYDFSGLRLYAHKLQNNVLVFDDAKYLELVAQKERADKNKQIDVYQKLLDDSDYIMAQTTENLLDCTTLVGFIKVFNEIKSKYKETIANRKEWRKQIQELRK